MEQIKDDKGDLIAEKNTSTLEIDGTYSICYYMDYDNNPCPKEKASKCHIHVFNKENELIRTIWGILDSSFTFRGQEKSRR